MLEVAGHARAAITRRTGRREKDNRMRTALLAQWQTAACLLVVLSLALVATGLPGYFTPSFFTDCLLILMPCGAGVVATRRGYRRLALGCGMLAAALSAFLFWWVLYVSAAALISSGLSAAALTAPLEGTVIAALLVGTTATLSGATGALWNTHLPVRRRLNARSARGPRLIG